MRSVGEYLTMAERGLATRSRGCRVRRLLVNNGTKGKTVKQTKEKNVLAGFFVIARFHRALGYNFITKAAENGRPRSKIISPYLLYAIVSWTLYVFVIGSDIVRVSTLLEDERNRVIDRAIQILGDVRCVGIQLSVVALLLSKSQQFVDLLEYLVGLERKLTRAAPLRRTAVVVVCLSVIFSFTSVLSISAEIYDFDEYSHAAYMKILYGMFSLVFAENVCMISFSWLAYFCSAFAGCLSLINDDVDRMSTELAVCPKELAELHRLFSDVGAAFVRLEDLLGMAILICFPLNIVSAAPWGYYMLKADKGTAIFMLDLIGFLTICAEMFAAGIYARLSKQEAKKTWDVLTKLLVSQEHTPEVREQIQEFRHTCQNQDFSFSGCGFFKVGPPLIVSIASAIITYTVILYQSDNSSSSTPAAPLNTTQA
ncbi:hypothetical protein HPB49_014883 [Dermacentor silvarum]|uniref:Uncharacterized protein n=1 Tax=Dermacentor silvarum TaxID=543639 RepID=A0ACB8C4B0_DERSI|nr:hypothetical protein HPB49_014883 [Dermacentor silvarum]